MKMIRRLSCLIGALFMIPWNTASAQDMYSYPLPPQTPVRDQFGVNLLVPNWQYVQPISLKSDLDPDLIFQLMTMNGGVFNWRSTLMGYVTGDATAYDTLYSVVIGAANFPFRHIGNTSVWTDITAMGNTLTRNASTGVFSFTRRDGVRFTFDPAPFSTQPPGTESLCAAEASNSPHICAVVTSIQYPDGKLITFQYEGRAIETSYPNVYSTYVRLRAAHSSNGISIKLSYSDDSQSSYILDWLKLASATLINDAYEYCNYPAGTCTSQYTWPTMSYSREIVNLPSGVHWITATVVDQAGFTHVFESSIQGWKLVTHKAGTPGAPGAVAATYLNDQGPPGGRGEGSPPSFADFTGPDGVTYQYRYNNVGGDVGGPNGGAYYEIHGTRTSSDGRTYSFVGNKQLPRSSVIMQDTDELGNSTNYDYDDYSRPTEIDLPEGNSTHYTYDANGNVLEVRKRAKSGSGLSDTVRSTSYPSSCSGPLICNKPLTSTDERDNVTSYVWDQTTGNLLSETLPADSTGVNPVLRYTYAPMFAWVSNGSGGYVPSASPRSMLTEMRTCRTSATVGNSCAAGSSDEIVTTYYYGPQSGPNNLLLRGRSVTSGGVTAVTCYGYDRLGNKTSETEPNANLQVCP